MNSYIHNDYSIKPYDFLGGSKHKNKDIKEEEEKKQIVVERDGKYSYTYMIDKEGRKILLRKIPVSQEEQQENLQNLIKPDSTNQCKQQMYMEGIHRRNLQEIMNIIKGNIG
ncbi:hypothetical protein [Maledivibacter halophilus]|uniref:Uncharacterized protein n=1 Tax=Maledivibacter halophilus TaxID=36842 RepID=A0A1T5ILF0_9FIRM|nr:hypothetical protein [Maledivibacter halophilus]SKC39996.1 hypothetical protein SAMN02194393_00518 [Maledivibacter halophilus]